MNLFWKSPPSSSNLFCVQGWFGSALAIMVSEKYFIIFSSEISSDLVHGCPKNVSPVRQPLTLFRPCDPNVYPSLNLYFGQNSPYHITSVYSHKYNDELSCTLFLFLNLTTGCFQCLLLIFFFEIFGAFLVTTSIFGNIFPPILALHVVLVKQFLHLSIFGNSGWQVKR